ncbi:MAG: hypothetical protein QG653_154 [Patescibacteria group bacterium]|nr:hypothetical protein [Patescibacteria group bacterium]
MTLQKIETFEHDIADEVLKKEAGVAKVAASDALVQDVQREASQQVARAPSSPFLMSLVIALVIIVVLGVGGYYAYAYFTGNPSSPKTSTSGTQPIPVTPNNSTKGTAPVTASFFEKTFPELKDGMGRFVKKAERNPYGYTISITEYSPVFSFIVKNEGVFAESVSNALDIPADYRSGSYVFTDTTIANNNMRVGTSGSSTVVYSFIGTNTILLSTSTDGITQASGAIIR